MMNNVTSKIFPAIVSAVLLTGCVTGSNLERVQAGMSREDSYAAVQRNAMQVWQHRGDRAGLFAQLLKADPEVADAIRHEEQRQRFGIELIASENFVSAAVLRAVGSVLTNKYAEGYPGKRYYGGCEYVDVVETLAIDRAKALFGAEYANVQPHSGATANAAVLHALINPGDKIMGLSLAHGGHLTHGMKLNFSGKLYEVAAYGLDEATYRVEMEKPGYRIGITEVRSSYDWLWAPVMCGPCEAIGELPSADMKGRSAPARFVQAAFYEYPKGFFRSFGRGLRLFSPEALLGNSYKLKAKDADYFEDWHAVGTPIVSVNLEPTG